MIESVNIAPNLRYERKFTIQSDNRAELLYQIKRHPAFFREIYHPRKINNIYVDTPLLQFYQHNKIGIANRKKVRIRWYGSTFVRTQKPRLEYKLKDGLLGDKWVFPVNDFEVKSGFSSAQFMTNLQQSDLPPSVIQDLATLRPSLLNTYHRTYFLSADRKFRLTLDEKMTYYRIDPKRSDFRTKHLDRNQFIIELKYAPEQDQEVDRISAQLPYRMDKSSKYVNGIDVFSRF